MTKNIAIIGASGYTGAELIRLIATHPDLEIAALAANSKAGQEMAQVFPHLRHLARPASSPGKRSTFPASTYASARCRTKPARKSSRSCPAI